MKFIIQVVTGITIGCLLGYKSISTIIENIKEDNNN